MKSPFLALGLIAGFAMSALSQKAPDADYKITVTGVVRSQDGEILKAAEIIAGDLRTLTNDQGVFTLPSIPGGSVLLVIRRIGYVPGTLSFQSEPGLLSMSVAATLAPAAVSLGTIVIEGKTFDNDLWKNGFYRRKNLGSGIFFDADRVTKTAASLSTLLSEVPSVRVDRRPGGAGIVQARATSGVGGQMYCSLNVFLDGLYLPWATQVGIDDVISMGDLKAIEVYPRANMLPTSIRGGTALQGTSTAALTTEGLALEGGNIECGAILLWSKTIPESKAANK